MRFGYTLRHALFWTAMAVAALLVLLMSFVVALDAGYGHHLLVWLLGVHNDRHIEVRGRFRTQLFSGHPQFIAETVAISNPSWMPAGATAEVDRLTLVLAAPRPGHWIRVDRLVLDGANLHLVRDDEGRSNWQLNAPSKLDTGELPLFRSLSMSAARATLDDARRHLRFTGTVSADELMERNSTPSFHIKGDGSLNGSPVSFEVISDPLATASRTQPYHFSFSERSDGARLTGSGALSHAFSFDRLQTSFESVGENLKDLYRLAGVTLINSGAYRLSGTLLRRGSISDFRDLVVSSGASDMHGSLSLDTLDNRARLSASLYSHLLRLSDLGEQAAHRDVRRDAEPALLLSDAALSPAGVRHGDAVVDFHAQRIDVGRVPLTQVAGKMLIDHGVLTVAPLTAAVLSGKLDAKFRMNAASDRPTSDIDSQLNGLQLGQLDRKPDAAERFNVPMDARVQISGRGASLHQIAASAEGTIVATLSPGIIPASLAELSDVDLRGMKLFLSKSRRHTAIRCGAARFQAHAGTLSTHDIVVDTDQVLITGEGEIHLDSETLRIALSGQPKGVRLLRMRAPILLSGTLLHPKFGLERPKSMQLLDRGEAHDVDCATLPN